MSFGSVSGPSSFKRKNTKKSAKASGASNLESADGIGESSDVEAGNEVDGAVVAETANKVLQEQVEGDVREASEETKKNVQEFLGNLG